MALTAAARYKIAEGQRTARFVVKPGETIYHGALVGLQVGGADDGEVVNWTDAVTAATIVFLGVAMVHGQEADASNANSQESVTGNTAGTVSVEVDISGVILQDVAITGHANVTDVGDLVYASDENTFTTTATAGSTPVGVAGKNTGTNRGDLLLFSYLQARAFEGR